MYFTNYVQICEHFCFLVLPMLSRGFKYGSINPNSLDNKGSWRILKDFYCSVTMLWELGLIDILPKVTGEADFTS